MREIKFRAWDGKVMRRNVTPWQWDFVIDRMAWRCDESCNKITGASYMQVPAYPFKELMQYTGLKDSTKWGQLSSSEQATWIERGETEATWEGKEIYEGDVLTSGGSLNLLVGWNNDGYWEVNGIPLHRLGREVEIIGNIYENPEL